jgi:hypothetical protein
MTWNEDSDVSPPISQELKGTVILLRLAHKSGAVLRVAYGSDQKSGFNLLRGARWPLSFTLKSIQKCT